MSDSQTDYSDIAELQKRMIEITDQISNMSSEVGKARHITSYDSDRRKRALALAAAPLLANNSSAAAETLARASETYHKSMAELTAQNLAAERTIAQWEALRIQWESVRSMLAIEREKVRM